MTREILWGRLRLAIGQYEASRSSLRRDLAAAARDNAILVNAELGLDSALDGYLEELSRGRGWDRAWVLDQDGRLLAASGGKARRERPELLTIMKYDASGSVPVLFLEAGGRPALTGSMTLEGSGGRPLGRILASIDLSSWCESASVAARAPVFVLFDDGSTALPTGFAASGLPKIRASGTGTDPERLEMLPVKIAGRDYVIGLAGLSETGSTGARIGVAWAKETFSEVRESGLAVLGVSALVALGLAAAGGSFFARRAFQPLAALAAAARDIGQGVYGQAVGTRSRDEVGDLVRDFNHMSRRLLAEERTREESEAAMQASIREKEVLLKEIHHRVKNNFQIINSLFELQLADVPDPALEEALRDPKARIHAMALVHDRLYQSRNFATLDFGAYIEELAGDLYFSYNTDPTRIALEVHAGRLDLDIDRAIPCGLILNELMTNSLKYAFPDRDRTGRIRVLLAETEGQVVLEVEDDGIGLPADLAANAGAENAGAAGTDAALQRKGRSSLGLNLARSLALQLRGEFRLSSGAGLRATLRFPRDKGG